MYDFLLSHLLLVLLLCLTLYMQIYGHLLSLANWVINTILCCLMISLIFFGCFLPNINLKSMMFFSLSKHMLKLNLKRTLKLFKAIMVANLIILPFTNFVLVIVWSFVSLAQILHHKMAKPKESFALFIICLVPCFFMPRFHPPFGFMRYIWLHIF